MKHEGFTPGPWRVSLSDYPKNTGTMYVRAGEDAVATVHKLNERRANAELIADAPRLAARVERLEAALRAACEVIPMRHMADHNGIGAQIRAALAEKE